LITWVLRFTLDILKDIVTITDPSGSSQLVTTLIDKAILGALDRATASSYSQLAPDADTSKRCAAVCLFWSEFKKELVPVMNAKLESASEDKKNLLRAFHQNVSTMAQRQPQEHKSFPFPPFSMTLLHYLHAAWNSEGVFFEHVRLRILIGTFPNTPKSSFSLSMPVLSNPSIAALVLATSTPLIVVPQITPS
jgi:hypothetical protein